MLIKHIFFLLRDWKFCILALMILCLYSPKACGDISVSAFMNETGYEGDIVWVSATYTTVVEPDQSYTAIINWGDGALEPGTVTPVTVYGTHEYGDNIETVVAVVVTGEENGANGIGVAYTEILNVDPTIDVGPDLTVNVGQAVNFSASFIDPGWLDTFTGNWNFDDGSAVVPASLAYENNYPDATGTAQNTYSFINAGTYDVTLTIYDDDGGMGTDSLLVTVVPIPGAVLLGMIGLSVAGVKLRKHA